MRRRIAIFVYAGLCLTGITCAPQAPPSAAKKTEFSDPVEPIAVPNVDPLPLHPDSALLKKRINVVLENIHSRPLLTTHGFWTIFHGILGMGPDTMLTDPDTDKKVRAIEQIASGKNVRGLEFAETPSGIDVITMPGTGVGQGHQDQFVAEMVQWNLPLTTKFNVNGKDYTFADFIRHSRDRASLTKKQELSWAIVIVSKHFGTNHKWKNIYGEELSLEDIAHYEANEPIKEAACGGTHRLFGLAWAYHLHLQEGGKTDGVWLEVAERLAEYRAKAKKFQNADGSFSKDYVSSPGHTRDIEQQISTTGHVFEWLCLTLTNDELRQPWMEKAAFALTTMVLEKKSFSIDGGALYHATHGLHMYEHRVFGAAGPTGLTIPLPPGKK
jgi:hypothetical protein